MGDDPALEKLVHTPDSPLAVLVSVSAYFTADIVFAALSNKGICQFRDIIRMSVHFQVLDNRHELGIDIPPERMFVITSIFKKLAALRYHFGSIF